MRNKHPVVLQELAALYYVMTAAADECRTDDPRNLGKQIVVLRKGPGV
jgi:hypothetical protein